MCDDKYLIYARVAVVGVALFVFLLGVLLIVKKKWRRLIIHVIISIILVCLLIWMGNDHKCSSESISFNEEGDTEHELISGYCAFKQKLNGIFHPVKIIEDVEPTPSFTEIASSWCPEGSYFHLSWIGGDIYQCNTMYNWEGFQDGDMCITCWFPGPKDCDCLPTPINQLIPEDIDLSLFEEYIDI